MVRHLVVGWDWFTCYFVRPIVVVKSRIWLLLLLSCCSKRRQFDACSRLVELARQAVPQQQQSSLRLNNNNLRVFLKVWENWKARYIVHILHPLSNLKFKPEILAVGVGVATKIDRHWLRQCLTERFWLSDASARRLETKGLLNSRET